MLKDWRPVLGCCSVLHDLSCSSFYWQLQLFSSVQFNRSVVSDPLRHHGLQHARLPCPSPIPRVYSNSCPLSGWCHQTISSSIVPFSCLQSFLASGSFPMIQFFTSSGQSIGVSASASVLPMNIQDWFPLGWTGWISLQSEGLSRGLPVTSLNYIYCQVGAQGGPKILIWGFPGGPVVKIPCFQSKGNGFSPWWRN